MKTKRVVALALAGALAFGGVLVTPPVLADGEMAVETQKEVTQKQLERAQEDMSDVITDYVDDADAKVKELEKKKTDDELEKKATETKTVKEAAEAELETAKQGQEAAKAAVKQAERNLEDAKTALNRLLKDNDLPDAKEETIDAKIDDLRKDKKENEAGALEAAKQGILDAQAMVDQAQTALDQANEDLTVANNKAEDAQFALDKATKPAEDAKAALEKADKEIEAAQKTLDEAKEVQELFDNLDLVADDINTHMDTKGKDPKAVIKTVFDRMYPSKAAKLAAILGNMPIVPPTPGEDQKPGDSEQPGGEQKPGDSQNPAKPDMNNKGDKKDEKKDKKDKKAPKTGDISVLAYAGSAVLAAGAFVASKKRK